MRRLRVVGAVCLIVGSLGVLTSPPLAAQHVDDATPYATVAAVSAPVPADGEWTAEFTLNREPPAGTRLRYMIHQPLATRNLRDRLAAAITGEELGPGLQNAVTLPLDQIRNASTVTLRVPIRPKSGPSDRILLPNAGIHPVQVELLAPDDSALFSQVLFLTRLPTTTSTPPLRVAPVLQIQGPPLVASDASVTVPAGTVEAVERAAGILDEHRSVPISLLIDPQLLDAVGYSQDPNAIAAVERLAGTVAERPLLRAPWVPVDITSVASAGGVPTLKASLAASQRAVQREFGQQPETATWPIDPTLSPAALPTLRSLDVEHLVLTPDQLVSAQPSTTDLAGRKVHIGSVDSGIDALVLDERITARLQDRTTDPPLAAHLALTEIAGIWFRLPEATSGAEVIDISSLTSDVAAELLSGLAASSGPLLEVSTLRAAVSDAAVATTGSRRRRDPMVLQLADREAKGTDAIAAELIRLRRRADSYHTTLGDPPDKAPLDHLLLTTQHRDLDAAQQLHYLAAAGERITTGLDRIKPPPPSSFTVTARTARLPLRIANTNDRPATVLLRFVGRRLEFNDGRSRRLVLQPGSNAFTVPVLVRTSGDFTARMEIRTADDRVLINSTTIRVRSTAVSGVGVLLGGGALAFLIVWWAMTIRRDRRRRKSPGAESPPSHDAAPVA